MLRDGLQFGIRKAAAVALHTPTAWFDEYDSGARTDVRDPRVLETEGKLTRSPNRVIRPNPYFRLLPPPTPSASEYSCLYHGTQRSTMADGPLEPGRRVNYCRARVEIVSGDS